LDGTCFFLLDDHNLYVVAFIYFRKCGKAYHPDCVGKDDSFFDTVESWVCGKPFHLLDLLLIFYLLTSSMQT